MMKRTEKTPIIVFLAFAALTTFVWFEIVAGKPVSQPTVYFLDVGQGDAELVVFPGGVKVLTDAGPDKKILASLEKALPAGDRYINIAVISHPQLDHFNGFNFMLDHYRVGVFILNGRSDTETVKEWPQLLEKIKAQNIPLVTLAAGDRIRFAENQIDFLSPDWNWIQSGELNDTGFVELVKTSAFRALLTADTGFNIENYLMSKNIDIRADVLKVGHHGSKYSSGDAFLAVVNPKVAVIEVGSGNRYGHPTKEALERLVASGAKIFRTDQNGTVEVFADNQKLKIFTEK